MTDPDDIACWQRIDAKLTTSGRLDRKDAARLADLGVKHVINLALSDSPGSLPEEAEAMAAAKLHYVHIPVPFDAPGETHFDAFASAMAKADGEPVHVHCIMNWRVSAFVYRWNRLRGMDAEKARALMQVQWDPASSGHKDAAAWAAFVNRA